MIYLYPAIVSSRISPASIPFICRTIERIILNEKIQDYQKSKKAINENYILFDDSDTLTENELLLEADKSDKFKITPGENLASEPATFIADDEIISVKVIPYFVSDIDKLSDLLIDEMNAKKLTTKALSLSRKIFRALKNSWVDNIFNYRPLQKSKDEDQLKKLRDFALYPEDAYEQTILIFSNTELREDVIQKRSALRKLFKLQWGSIVVCDDVNKRASICMKQFKGLCNIIDYQYMALAISKDHLSVYQDQEDLKQSTSPFFRRKYDINRVLENTLLKDYVDENVIKESDNYFEGIVNNNPKLNLMLNSVGKNNIAIMSDKISEIEEDDLRSSINMSKKLLKLSKNCPVYSDSDVETICKRMIGEQHSFSWFNKLLEPNENILRKHFPNRSDKFIHSLACFISMISSWTVKPAKANLLLMKNVIPRAKRYEAKLGLKDKLTQQDKWVLLEVQLLVAIMIVIPIITLKVVIPAVAWIATYAVILLKIAMVMVCVIFLSGLVGSALGRGASASEKKTDVN